MNIQPARLWIVSVALCLALAVPAAAQTYAQDFETETPAFFHTPITGVSCAGSTIETTQGRAHSGKHAAKLSYKFSAKGYINLVTDAPPVVISKGGTLHLSVWVYGAGHRNFTDVGLDLVDEDGVTYQFVLPPEFAAALAGNAWQQAQCDIDITKPNGHWGGTYTGGVKMPLKLVGFGLDFGKDGAAQGEVFLDDLSLTGDPPARAAEAVPAPPSAAALPLPAVSVTLQPTVTQMYFYPVGASVHARVHGAASSRLNWTARDFSDAVLTQGKVQTDAQGNGAFTVPARRPGMVYVTVTAPGQSSSTETDGATRFAVLAADANAARPALPIVYGVCAGMGRASPADREREASLMATLGFHACRFDYNWEAVQPARDVWHWDQYDAVFDSLNRHGITPLPIVDYTVRWATTGNPDATDWHQWANAPPVTQDYAHFAAESARHYRHQGHYWELWNEPDIDFWLGTAQQYAALFDAASTAIKAADPDARVLNGGFSETRRRPTFIPDWQHGAQVQPDIFAFHSHMIFANMLRANDTVQVLNRQAGWTMPKWLNEAGFSSFGLLTERDQAVALVKKMAAAPALGISGYVWYDLMNNGTDPKDAEQNFGLVRADYTPKAAAVAARTLLTLLQGQTYVRRLDVPGTPDAYALLFGNKNGKGGTLVLWNEADSTAPLFWRATGARRVSLMGEATPLTSKGRLTALSVSPEPQFMGFTSPVVQFTAAGRLLSFPSPLVSAPGDTVSLPVTLRNPFPHPLRGTVSLREAESWHRNQSRITVRVPAGGTKVLSVAVTAPAVRQPKNTLQIAFASPNLPVTLEAAVTLQQMTVVPRRTLPTPLGDFSAWGTPTATLGRANVVSLYEATPMQELLYHGASDLSARVYLARVPTGLRVAVRVQDDVFSQNEAAGTEWQGDSLQMGLRLPSSDSYEWTAALTAGGPAVSLGISPADKGLGKVTLPVSVRRVGTETLYDLIIPAVLPDGKMLGNRFSFSVLVNDNDGAGRKGWVEWTPGIGRSKDPALFEPIVVR